MRLGIISDTHDNLKKIDKAIKLFNRKKTDYVLHGGDFVAPFSVLRFKNLNCPWEGVFGNNDGEAKNISSG
ncbi:MAG: metallophosphoesterase family protein [Candidatus Omnitrophica bacterium]|nr:metallophosphoesterase family protein [Candidatus Omnitrophota bacterium]